MSRHVYISNATEDAPVCEPLVSALRAWGVACWYEVGSRTAGHISTEAQRALVDSDVFLRVCTFSANRSYWMEMESAAVRSLEAEDYRTTGQSRRFLINLVLDEGYRRVPFDSGAALVDAAHLPPSAWVGQLRQALDLPPLASSEAEALGNVISGKARARLAANRARITRRRLLRGGAAAAGLVAVAAGSLAYIETRPRTLQNFSPPPTPAATGSDILWSFRTGDQIASSPVLNGSTLLVTSEDGTLYALDTTQRGALKWKYTSPDTTALYCDPRVYQGLIFVVPQGSSYVYAVDAATGEQRWARNGFGELLSYYTPAAAGGRLYVANDFGPGLVTVLDLNTREFIRLTPPSQNCTSSLTIANDTLYLTGGDLDTNNQNAFYALRLKDVSALWSTSIGDWGSNYPAVADGRVFLGARDGNLYCMDAKTGKVLWKYLTGGKVYGTPLATVDTVYVGSDDTYIYALNAVTGAKRWRLKTGDFVRSTPTLSAGTLYVGSYDHKLYALDAASGTLLKTYAINGSIRSKPVVTSDGIYVASGDRNVYAFRR